MSTRPHWGDYIVAQGIEGAPASHIGGDEAGLPALFSDRSHAGGGLFLASTDQDNLGARLRQPFAHCAAEFAGSADHNSDFAVEGEEFGKEFGHGERLLEGSGRQGQLQGTHGIFDP